MDINVLHRGQCSNDFQKWWMENWYLSNEELDTNVIYIHNIETGGVKSYSWYSYIYNRHTAILAPLLFQCEQKGL